MSAPIKPWQRHAKLIANTDVAIDRNIRAKQGEVSATFGDVVPNAVYGGTNIVEHNDFIPPGEKITALSTATTSSKRHDSGAKTGGDEENVSSVAGHASGTNGINGTNSKAITAGTNGTSGVTGVYGPDSFQRNLYSGNYVAGNAGHSGDYGGSAGYGGMQGGYNGNYGGYNGGYGGYSGGYDGYGGGYGGYSGGYGGYSGGYGGYSGGYGGYSGGYGGYSGGYGGYSGGYGGFNTPYNMRYGFDPFGSGRYYGDSLSENNWFGRTAETLGNFSQLLDMNSWFLDQLVDISFNLVGRVRSVKDNFLSLPIFTVRSSNRLTSSISNFLFGHSGMQYVTETIQKRITDGAYATGCACTDAVRPEDGHYDDNEEYTFPYELVKTTTNGNRQYLYSKFAEKWLLPLIRRYNKLKSALDIFKKRGYSEEKIALIKYRLLTIVFVMYILIGTALRYFR